MTSKDVTGLRGRAACLLSLRLAGRAGDVEKAEFQATVQGLHKALGSRSERRLAERKKLKQAGRPA